MNKKLIIIIALVVAAAGIVFFLARGPQTETLTATSDERESLSIEEDLTPVPLTEEERQAAEEEGLYLPSDSDTNAENLQSVRISDDLGSIEADLNETELSGFDAELDSINDDLSDF